MTYRIHVCPKCRRQQGPTSCVHHDEHVSTVEVEVVDRAVADQVFSALAAVDDLVRAQGLRFRVWPTAADIALAKYREAAVGR